MIPRKLGLGARHFRHVNLREDSRGGEPLDTPAIPFELLPRTWDRVILFVHGYNVDKKAARRAFAAAESHIQSVAPSLINDILGLYWPGDWDTPSKIINSLAYRSRLKDAEKLGPVLARFLWKFGEVTPECPITLVGHSLGCRMILEALAELNENPAYSGMDPFPLVILMAPAVPVGYMQDSHRLFKALKKAKRWVVLYSRTDRVLRYGFPPGQVHAEGRAAGIWPEAVGLWGLPGPTVWDDPEEMRSFGHGDYWVSGALALRLVREFGQLSWVAHEASQPPPNVVAHRQGPAVRSEPQARGGPAQRALGAAGKY